MNGLICQTNQALFFDPEAMDNEKKLVCLKLILTCQIKIRY